MKKGLLSILASALLVVGCQNYDDQFSALETQINALASTVAGLSQVQSDLSTLAGTVNSLASTVNGLGSQIDTAVSDGLADIQADITAIETAVADVASSEEVSSLSDAVADSAADLDELLANSAVFNGPVSITSVATLNAFHAMGSSLNIVNGAVVFDVKAGMDSTKVQETINQMLTITGDLTYKGASTEPMPTFANLSGVASMTIEGAGNYDFSTLVSAGNIILNNDSSKTTVVAFDALTTYLSISDDDSGSAILNRIKFSKATNIHLTSVTVLPGSKLDVTLDEGGELRLNGLTGLNSLKTVDTVDLDIEGAASVTMTKIQAGNINLKDVKKASISDFYGAIVIDEGVEDLTVTKGVSLDISLAADLEKATINMVTDYNPANTAAQVTAAALVTAYKDIVFASQDLLEATVSGKVGTLNATAQNNMTKLTVTSGSHVTALIAKDNTDLTDLIVNGATIGNVTADNNDNMEGLILDHTSYVTTANPGTIVSVDGNADLLSLEIKADLIGTLSIESNDDLALIKADGLKLVGSTESTVSIKDNELKVTSLADKYNATPSATVNDDGSFDQTSIVGFQTYLDAAVKVASTAGVKVWFDEIDSATEQLTSITTAFTDLTITTVDYTAANMYSLVFVEKNNAAPTGNNVSQSVTLVLPVTRDVNGNDTLLETTVGRDAITVVNGVGGSKTFEATTAITTVDQLVAAMNGDTTVANLTLQSDRDAFHEQVVSIAYTYSDGAAATTSSADGGAGNLYFTYGTDPESGALIEGVANVAAGSASGAIAEDFATAFNAATNAYVATATLDGKLYITALVSGTLLEDRGPIPHAFNTFAVNATAHTTTVDLAGAFAAHTTAASAMSNVTAVASGLYNFTTSSNSYSGVRVTAVNGSSSVNLGSMSVAVAAANSQAFVGTTPRPGAGGESPASAALLVAGTNIVAASINSSALNYVAAFSDVETQGTSTNTGGTTDRTSWLSN